MSDPKPNRKKSNGTWTWTGLIAILGILIGSLFRGAFEELGSNLYKRYFTTESKENLDDPPILEINQDTLKSIDHKGILQKNLHKLLLIGDFSQADLERRKIASDWLRGTLMSSAKVTLIDYDSTNFPISLEEFLRIAQTRTSNLEIEVVSYSPENPPFYNLEIRLINEYW